ncbi:putative harbinger transposase-derived nuclease domain-containing protein [Rosa chinensis]|uniref:Putative harbinger transposase-derived nuclease domain-containing protein n=1 Tax=Rosa chinensis TaxID=74649 RepID=A0A2P6Q1E9_ROSCH|nr:protein ALP1-like [Rosa chinensis]PRQ27997.1 putative harbinger transposase-derived nuclease domain-containing protein [Rosa chinensis]
MKLKPIPNPDPDLDQPDLSYIYSFLHSSLHHQMNNDTAKKRRRKTADDDGPPGKQGKMKDLKGIITTLSLLEQQEKEDLDRASNDDKSFAEEKQKQTTKTKAMVEHYSDLQGYYSDVEESETVNRKKSRNAATAAVAAAAAVDASEKGAKPGGSGSGHQRRLWVKDRSKAWWDECNQPDFPEEEFKKAFRMGKATFDLICDELNSAIAKEDTTLRNAIPVRQRVAVCLWRLATGDPLRLVSKRFGLGISTCHKLVLEVCSAIRTVLMPKYLNWPEDGVLRKVKEEFESFSGIPNVVGSMYTTHIPIIAPKISVAAYFNKRHTERNQKTSYSITVQGVVNPKGVFTDVCIGWPGSMPDDQVLEKSALHQRAGNGLLKGVWIVGGSGYPLLDWVLVPYTQQHLTWTQHAFNEKIGEIQNVSKDAFARLKGRWLCLQKRTEVKLQDLPVVLGACCVLHNICELRNEEIDPDLRFELVDDEMVPEIAVRSQSSKKARDAIAHNLLHHGLAGTSFL